MLVSHLTLTFSRSALLQQKRLGSPNNPPECRYYEVEKWNKINIKLKFYGSLFNPSFFSHTHDIESKSSTLYHVVKATTTTLIFLHPYRSSGRDTQHIYITYFVINATNSSPRQNTAHTTDRKKSLHSRLRNESEKVLGEELHFSA